MQTAEDTVVNPANTVERAAQKLQEIHAQKNGRDWTKSRPLTEAEWEEVKDSIEKFHFPCSLHCTAYGFVFVVHNHEPIQDAHPDPLLCVEHGEFPFQSSKKGFDGQLETLGTLSSITHSPRNTEVLAWYGFDPLHELSSYTY